MFGLATVIFVTVVFSSRCIVAGTCVLFTQNSFV